MLDWAPVGVPGGIFSHLKKAARKPVSLMQPLGRHYNTTPWNVLLVNPAWGTAPPVAVSRVYWSNPANVRFAIDFPTEISLKKYLLIVRKKEALRLAVLSHVLSTREESQVWVCRGFIPFSPNTSQIGTLHLQDTLSYQRHALFPFSMSEQILFHTSSKARHLLPPAPSLFWNPWNVTVMFLSCSGHGSTCTVKTIPPSSEKKPNSIIINNWPRMKTFQKVPTPHRSLVAFV